MLAAKCAFTAISDRQGDRILGLGCHKGSRGAIMLCVLPRMPRPKSTLSTHLGHPIPYHNDVRLFIDPRLYFDTVFKLTTQFCLFCPKTPDLLDFACTAYV